MGTTQTFPAWLAVQDPLPGSTADAPPSGASEPAARGPSDEVGELAKHVASPGDFPASGGKAIYDGYFETERSSRREAFERAWAEFSASPEPMPEADGRRS